ncbi:MAG: hypothetical protein QM479_08630 [Pseudomonadota bacterium]
MAIGGNEPSLFEIKNNELSNVNNLWIGSLAAFNIFQKYYLKEENNAYSDFEGMHTQIIKLPDVNDKVIRNNYSNIFYAMLLL